MRRMGSAYLKVILAGAVLSGSLQACAAKNVTANWPAECVGRMQLQLPGSADVAAYTGVRLSNELDIGSSQQQFEFGDSSSAGYSSLTYLGRIYVSHPLIQQDQTDIFRKTHELSKRVSKWASEKPRAGPRRTFERLSIGDRKGGAWRVDSSYAATFGVGDSIISWGVSGENDADKLSNAQAFDTIVNRARVRAAFEVPKQPGVCLPYTFIPDQGTEGRDVRMTYRLKEHPDVQIMLMDASAARPPPGNHTKNAEPFPVINSIWEQHLTTNKEVHSLWLPLTQSVKLAGFKGLASFVEIKREDNSLDYGYLAVVRGNPDAREDTPDLRLYIIRDAAVARTKGKEPISKEAFIELAETVASSVRRRPVEKIQ